MIPTWLLVCAILAAGALLMIVTGLFLPWLAD